ncbi:hypothetical protein HB779_12145 [Phyllobacterium sp. 628]|uniref:RNase A-like domain-containing protein n=1 Tax=Phyllobacterium sp. 628 TaxID=2718938 RepID=UPI0016625C9B|nr:RNase A-like domain-containing protein [Phyllobacterium sp. 628]QND52569.1 hypothetical protein HB779_12145 [Phyllobacterium sp. 628]
MSGAIEDDADVGITIILSAVQMAAVIERETIEQDGTIGNRLIGGLRILGCVVEATGAAALFAAPEPTMVTKVGGGLLLAYAADQGSTGLRQVWTGRDERSLLSSGASSLARQMGASPSTADNVGMAAEIVVPLGTAALVGALRASAVRAGRISLAQHEAAAGSRLGGHTIDLHVGKTEGFLRQRIIDTATRRNAPAAISSFTDFATAETHISRALQVNKQIIANWATTASPGAKMVLNFNAGTTVGRGVVRATGQYVPMSGMRVVLKKETYNGLTHFILTAYPAL